MLWTDIQESFGIAVTNLVSIPVLAFALGVLASRLRGDLRLPDQAYQVISIILLLAIGLKGGVALRQASLGDIVVPIAATLLLSVVVPVAAFAALKLLTPLGRLDRGAIAAHYGSTSLVTFTAALVLLETTGVAVEAFSPTLLAIMEVPGIVIGLMLATAGSTEGSRGWKVGLLEVLASRSVLLLLGGLAIGAAVGAGGYARVEPLFGGLFQGLLALFLLHCGTLVGDRFGDVVKAGWGMFVFAIGFPAVVGPLSVLLGVAIGMSTGGAVVLGVLAASASYIAAPAAVRIALPGANEAVALTSSLAVTFPFNLLINLPIMLAVATALS